MLGGLAIEPPAHASPPVTSSCDSVALPAVSNADFTSNLAGWSTDYSPGIDNTGNYAIGPKLSIVAPRFLQYSPDFSAKTGGNFVFVNGSLNPADRILYRQFTVVAGNTYRARIWARRVVLPSLVKASVSGVSITVDLSALPNEWNAVDLVFKATATTADFAVTERSAQSFGSDIALSNFELSQCDSPFIYVAFGDSYQSLRAGLH